MIKYRVVYWPDGTVAVIKPSLKSRREGENDADFLKRTFDKALIPEIVVEDPLGGPRATKKVPNLLYGLPFEDINPADLPDKKDRGKWRGEKGKGVFVDPTVVTPVEKRQADIDEQAILLGKSKPTNAETMRALALDRKIRGNEYT